MQTKCHPELSLRYFKKLNRKMKNYESQSKIEALHHIHQDFPKDTETEQNVVTLDKPESP